MLFQDQTGCQVEIKRTSRIISIVPSQTEFLVDIGLKNHLVGVTKFCIHPKGLVHEIGHVGGTKNLNIEKIMALQPDLIIGNKEENTKSEIEELRKHFPVWMSDIYTVDQGIEMMQQLGEILDRKKEADELVQEIESERLLYKSNSLNRKSCLYFIWKDPDMVVGNQSFIHSMLDEAGLKNIGSELGERYPIVDENDKKLNPDYVFLSSEPYPFKKNDIVNFKNKYPDSEVVLVDGEMFSWYGSRMKLAYQYFREFLKNERS